MLTHTVCELLGWIPGPVGSIANAVDGLVYLLVDKDYKNALYSLGSLVGFGAGKLVAWAGKGSKTALRIRRVCNFVGSGINFAQSAEGTVNMGGMMIDKYIIQGQPVSGTTALEFLFLGANIFGATKSGAAIATDVRDFGKFVKMAGITSLKGDNRGVANAKALIDAFKSGTPSGYYQDANGRWRRPNGQFASNGEVGIANNSEHYLHRPYIRQSTIDVVNANTKVNYKTGQIYDEISRKWVNPSNVELGHTTGNEYWYWRNWAESQGMTQAQFNEFMNNPDFYRWQDVTSNRSHLYEDPH